MPTPEPGPSVELDVSALVPPEPLLEIFRALVELPDGHKLQVNHRRQPFPLYPMLEQCGFNYHCSGGEGRYLIEIWAGSDADPTALARLIAEAPACP